MLPSAQVPSTLDSRRVGHDVPCPIFHRDDAACTTWVGITDRDWFETLRRLQLDEVDFWQPSRRAPCAMDAGWPYLFKLHWPQNFVAGGSSSGSPNSPAFWRGTRFVVSPRLHEEFENGRVYYALDGRSLANVPDRLLDQPGREFLEWHNSEVFPG